MVERLVEAGLLAGVGGALGVALAPAVGSWILSFLNVSGPEMALSSQLDGRALTTALAISVVATLLSGVGPAWFAASAKPMGALKVRGGTSGGALGLRKALVIGQVSLALVFLMGAGLFGKSLHSLRSEGPGFSTDRPPTMSTSSLNRSESYDGSLTRCRGTPWSVLQASRSTRSWKGADGGVPSWWRVRGGQKRSPCRGTL